VSRSLRGLDWASDRDAAVNTEFFSEAEAISVENTPSSQLELSDEEKTEPYAEVRFDSDGFAFEKEISCEVENEHALEPMPLPGQMGLTEWSSDFAEVHARVREFSIVSKVSAIRYVSRGEVIKVSSLPSVVDFLADVQIVARKCLSPALYRVWHKVYFEGYGQGADRVPETVQLAIQQRCATAWKKIGLLPFGRYWSVRVKAENVRAMGFPVPRDLRAERNARRRAQREKRNAPLRERRAQTKHRARMITTLAVAA
jgi:hypothetical protein